MPNVEVGTFLAWAIHFNGLHSVVEFLPIEATQAADHFFHIALLRFPDRFVCHRCRDLAAALPLFVVVLHDLVVESLLLI